MRSDYRIMNGRQHPQDVRELSDEMYFENSFSWIKCRKKKIANVVNTMKLLTTYKTWR